MFGWGGKSKAKSQSAFSDKPKFEMTIGGRGVSANAYDPVVNPATLDVVGWAPLATEATLDLAVEAAQSAFETWSKTSDEERAAACMAVAKVFEDNLPELSRLITQEQGKPLDGGGLGSRFEVGGCAGWSRATASMKLEDKVIQDDGGHLIVQTHVPHGVVGSITPWNWPVLIAVWHILPAIRTGNTVVIKPSPLTPLSTLRAVALMNTVLPAGVVNVVAGGPQIGALMTNHPGIQKIVFTGSTATGRRIMESAARSVKRITLELGGNDAAIVLPGSDLERITPGLFFGSFINAGQTCGAIKRLYVHASQYDAVCQALSGMAGQMPVGDGLEPSTMIGPLQNKMQFDKIRGLVDHARKAGATVLTGGEPLGQGYFYAVTLLANCQAGMRIVDEEQFGPVLPIIKYDDLDDAIAQANGLEFGLCASVWGEDPHQLSVVASRLEAGTVYVNTHAELNPMTPFGGMKASGLGVAFGVEGLASYTDIKVIYQKKFEAA